MAAARGWVMGRVGLLEQREERVIVCIGSAGESCEEQVAKGTQAQAQRGTWEAVRRARESHRRVSCINAVVLPIPTPSHSHPPCGSTQQYQNGGSASARAPHAQCVAHTTAQPHDHVTPQPHAHTTPQPRAQTTQTRPPEVQPQSETGFLCERDASARGRGKGRVGHTAGTDREGRPESYRQSGRILHVSQPLQEAGVEQHRAVAVGLEVAAGTRGIGNGSSFALHTVTLSHSRTAKLTAKSPSRRRVLRRVAPSVAQSLSHAATYSHTAQSHIRVCAQCTQSCSERTAVQ